MYSTSKNLDVNNLKKCQSRPWESKETMRCTFCGGPSCIRCSSDAYLNCINPGIEKFNCNWITDSILAMQRPSNELIEKISLVDKFKTNGITAIFNLTEPGEHPFCGPGLDVSSGFPYSPERFMAVGSKYIIHSFVE